MDPANIYLCPVCRPGGKAPIVNRNMYLSQITDNGQMIDDGMDENSQDSMSIASENDEMCKFRELIVKMLLKCTPV